MSVLPLAFGVPAHAPGRLGHLAAHSPFAASPNSRFAFPVCPGRTHSLPLPACTPSGALVTSRDLRAVIFTSVHSDIRVCSWRCTFRGVGQASHSTYLPLEGHAEQLLVPKPSVPSLPGEPRRSAWRPRLQGHRAPPRMQTIRVCEAGSLCGRRCCSPHSRDAEVALEVAAVLGASCCPRPDLVMHSAKGSLAPPSCQGSAEPQAPGLACGDPGLDLQRAASLPSLVVKEFRGPEGSSTPVVLSCDSEVLHCGWLL